MDASSHPTTGDQDTSSSEITDLAEYFDNGPQESSQTSSDEAPTTTVEETVELPSKKDTLSNL